MSKMEEAIFRWTKTQNDMMSLQHSLQREVRAVTLKLVALEGKLEQWIHNRNYEQTSQELTKYRLVQDDNKGSQNILEEISKKNKGELWQPTDGDRSWATSTRT